MIYDDEVIEKGGFSFRVNFEQDNDMGPPWENCDGHGPVGPWTRRDKYPGEWVISSDHGSKRFYDAQAANEQAKKEGWGLGEKEKAELLTQLCRPRIVRLKKPIATFIDQGNGTQLLDRTKPFQLTREIRRDPNKPLTAGEIRAEAVRRDYEFLRGWCNDDWHYCGVIVTLIPEGEDARYVSKDYGHALWGIEDNADDYLEEVAHELIDGYVAELVKERDESAYWAARDLMTEA